MENSPENNHHDNEGGIHRAADAERILTLTREARNILWQNGSDQWVIPIIKEWLKKSSSRVADALTLTEMLHPSDISTLAPLFIRFSLSDTHAVRITRLLGQLPREKMRRLVIDYAHGQLNKYEDYYDYWKIASLLNDLGLTDEVQRLAERALKSGDPEVQEIGNDIIDDMLKT